MVLEWTDDALMSPYRDGMQRPREADPIREEVNRLTEGNRIEIMELMTPGQDA